MFKKILDFFGSENKGGKSSTSRANEINRLIINHKRRLALLEQQQARTGPDTPPMIITEIEDIKLKIAGLEAKLQKTNESPLPKMPDKLRQLYEQAEENLEDFRKILQTTTTELDFLPERSRPGAIRLLDIGKSHLSELEETWGKFHRQQPASEGVLRAFIKQIAQYREDISILVQRGIYRKNLGIVEKQLALRQSALTKDELETTLRPQLDFEKERINLLETKKHLDGNDQETLAIHRNNLKIYQEMLAGQRPYAPLALVNQVISQEQAIQDIDNRLVSL
jgi:hypothetical protein